MGESGVMMPLTGFAGIMPAGSSTLTGDDSNIYSPQALQSLSFTNPQYGAVEQANLPIPLRILMAARQRAGIGGVGPGEGTVGTPQIGPPPVTVATSPAPDQSTGPMMPPLGTQPGGPFGLPVATQSVIPDMLRDLYQQDPGARDPRSGGQTRDTSMDIGRDTTKDTAKGAYSA